MCIDLGGVTIKALLNIKRIVFNDKTKTRQFTCHLVKIHAGNSNNVVHTFQIVITGLTTTRIVSAPDFKRPQF